MMREKFPKGWHKEFPNQLIIVSVTIVGLISYFTDSYFSIISFFAGIAIGRYLEDVWQNPEKLRKRKEFLE
ncbi:MAG: hypothetical protein Q7J70_07200 [Thermodesulfovibrionales bacterium]|nr:hypothetical protein [Thermodesulfovibrionales bacterium]